MVLAVQPCQRQAVQAAAAMVIALPWELREQRVLAVKVLLAAVVQVATAVRVVAAELVLLGLILLAAAVLAQREGQVFLLLFLVQPCITAAVAVVREQVLVLAQVG